jgi:hypothetical protein
MSDSVLPLSCGAILYAYNLKGELGVILGDEARNSIVSYLPFKGGVEKGETPEEAAIREIEEETCGLIKLTNIVLEHKFTTKRKEYHIGLIEVPYSIIDQFNKIIKTEDKTHFKEKRQIKFFLQKDLYRNPEIHPITKASLVFYKNKLDALAKGNTVDHNFTYFCGISINNIKRCGVYDKLEKCMQLKSWRKECSLGNLLSAVT